MYEYSARMLQTLNGAVADLMIDVGFNIYTMVRVRIKGICVPDFYSNSEEETLYPISEEELAIRAAAKSADRWESAAKVADKCLEALLSQSPLRVKTEAIGGTGKRSFYLATITNSEGIDVGSEMVKMGHAVFAIDGARPSVPRPRT